MTSASSMARMRSVTETARESPPDISSPGTNNTAITRPVVGQKPKRAPRHSGYWRLAAVQRRARSKRRPCCNVDTSASVDSVPWFRLGPSALRPS